MPPKIPLATRIVLVLTSVLGLGAVFVAARLTEPGATGALIAFLWFLAPSIVLGLLAWASRVDVRLRKATSVSTWLVVLPLFFWMALAALAAVTVEGEAGLGAAVGLGYLGVFLPLVQVAAVAAVYSVARLARGSFATASRLGVAVAVLLCAAGVLLYSTGAFPRFLNLLVEAVIFGPSRRHASEELARRPPNQDVPWDRENAARRRWLESEGSEFTDASGRRFRKQARWQEFKTGRSSGYTPSGEYSSRASVEGDLVEMNAPGSRTTYSGSATFELRRSPEGHWILTGVRLDGVSLTSVASIALADLAVPPSPPAAPPASPPVPLTAENAKAAMEEWLAGKYPLGEDLMKDAGGTVEILGLSGRNARIRVTNVPYHRLGNAAPQQYSGPGEAAFAADTAGALALYGVWLTELELYRDVPAFWSEHPNLGIRVR